ncbi:MAG: serine/threonine-protein phosphatase [Deltaproteobacteria bacterium]|nr:serine/threonine-protein phosphatase [Deltaproteobacteria bacterium]
MSLHVAIGHAPGVAHLHSEDRWLLNTLPDGSALLGVCDGMGGMGRGAEASALAVALLEEHLRESEGFAPHRLRDAILFADQQVRARLCAQGNGLPGSTAALVLVSGPLAHVAWAGDSRAYWLRGGALRERTADHKLLEALIQMGTLTREEAERSSNAHVITRAIGGRRPGEEPVDPELLDHPWALAPGDRLLLCSDGLADLVSDEEVSSLTASAPVEEACQALVRLALERGGHDDTTVVIAEWEGEGPALFHTEHPFPPADQWSAPPQDEAPPPPPAAPTAPWSARPEVLLMLAGALVLLLAIGLGGWLVLQAVQDAQQTEAAP